MKIWVFPAIFTGIVAVIFLLAFNKEDQIIDETGGG